MSRLLLLLAATSCSMPDDPDRLDPFVVQFPDDFLWGGVTSPYQLEGHTRADGSVVESNWSRWEKNVASGETNPHGSGFYERYDDDFALAQSDGHTAVRIGIEWARIEPMPGRYDQREIDHYVGQIEAARARGLRVVLTLSHWVLPVWVADPEAGLDAFATPMNRELWDRFDAMLRQVLPRVGGSVDHYVTFNEPLSVAALGYLTGAHPPGKVFEYDTAANYLVNVAFMHARTYRTLQELDTTDADGDGRSTMIGMAMLSGPFLPVDPNDEGDVAGAEQLTYLVDQLLPNALVFGDLDVNFDRDAVDTDTVPPEGNYPELAGTLDYLGINYYGPIRVEQFLPPILGFPLQSVAEYDPSLPHSDLGRAIDASGLRTVLDGYGDRYGLPFFITENGLDTQVIDQRGMYVVDHLYVLGRAIADGYSVLGYLHWSLVDNFEWVEGFAPNFGLYRVDREHDLTRSPTLGAMALRDVIAAGGIDRELYDEYVEERYPSDGR